MTTSNIQKLLKEKNYLITIEDYKEIIQSPQLVCISYKQENDIFEIQLYSGEIWAFKVERDRKDG